MQAVKFVDSALNILKSKQSTRERYRGEEEWLMERRAIWSGNRIRVGVLGVTSSGKSTLINAVIGMELLSTAVRPTSGQLVECIKGEIPQAKISFESSGDILLQGDKLCLDEIKEYSDENYNRENKRKVKKIAISTPGFDFGDNVVLIDSAGLDAYKLENHEKLSLETLLPTIDMCIFVTTLMANSDEKSRTVLNAVAKHNCPLLIVQNMLDSVMPSADGRKSKEMVAQEHEKRLRRIIDNSDIKDKSAVYVVQISAFTEMEKKCRKKKAAEDSRYLEFKKIVDAMVEAAVPEIDEDRCRTIAVRYNEFIKSEEDAISQTPTEKPVFRYEGLKEKLKRDIDGIDRELKEALSGLQREHGGNNADRSRSAVKKAVEKSEEAILLAITKANSLISGTAKRLNIPSRDLNVQVQLEKIPEYREVTKTETRTRKVEKDGFFSGVARFFGGLFGKDDWGYDYENTTVETIDQARTDEERKKYIERTLRAHTRTVNGWRDGLEITLGSINSYIDKEYRSFKEHQKKIENDADVKSILVALKTMLKDIKLPAKTGVSRARKVSVESGGKNAQQSRMALSKYQLGLYDISKNVLQTMSKSVLEKCGATVQAPPLKIVLGWDAHSMLNFAVRYMGISFDIQTIEKKGEIILKGIIFVLRPEAVQLIKMKRDNPPASFFVMVNAQQDGSARNQISKLSLKANLKRGDKVFLVVQDFESLLNSGGIREMKANLLEYYKEFEINEYRGLVIINDDNPMYNLAFVQSQLEPCKNMAEENEFLALLIERYKRFNFLWDAKTSDIIGILIRNS